MSRATIDRFYAAFQRLDAATMQACYAEQARFDDEAFSLQDREAVGAMWRMLCETTRTKAPADWKLEYTVLGEPGTHGAARWTAHYRFVATGRLVVNRIEAQFEFDAAGLIVRHVDRFDFAAWARQALGLPGLLLGWSPWLRRQVRQRAAAQLARYRSGLRAASE